MIRMNGMKSIEGVSQYPEPCFSGPANCFYKLESVSIETILVFVSRRHDESEE